MVRNVAPLMQDLEAADFHLLSGVEHGMRFSEWVDRGRLPKFSELDSKAAQYRIDRCLDRELIKRQTIQYEGYQLTFAGYDALALRTFSQRGTIDAVGSPLGEGKESDVIEARNDEPVALKFHREGLTNFREVQKERDYTADKDHVSWLYTARKAAEREFEVLTDLYPTVSVPKPIDHNRHAIVMERMDGIELSRARIEDNVPATLREILHQLSAVYELGWVHNDMSEFNVFVDGSGITIFDWPQALEVEHPNAEERLRRDIKNIVDYFSRKYPKAIDEGLNPASVTKHIQGNSVGELQLMANR